MFEKFGEFDSAAQINELAKNLRIEGDKESIKLLAEENGLDMEIVEMFISGDLLWITDEMSAALGKLDVESADLKPYGIMEDWAAYIQQQCAESVDMAVAVRRNGKTMKACMAELLKWSFSNAKPVDKDILKAAGVNASKVTLGIPGMGQAKRLIREYYLGR